jgi:fibronectin-binding autotransporter adhesin
LASTGAPGALGVPTSAAGNLLLQGGTLSYVGAGENTNRLFTVSPTGGAIDASGSGAVVFNNGGGVVSADAAARAATTESTSSTTITLSSVYDLVAGMTVTGTNIVPGSTIVSVNPTAGSIKISAAPTAASSSTSPDTLSFSVVPRTLTLTGTSTANNTMGNVLANSAGGGGLSLTKTGIGKWILSAANTYSGNTTVNAGTLEIGATGSISSSTTTVGPSGTLNVIGSIPSTATVNANGAVNFAGNTGTVPTTRTLGALNIGIGTTAVTVVLPSTAAFYPKTLNPTSLTFADTAGKLDLTNNKLITAGSAATALALINGGQLVSSSISNSPPTGLGYIDLPGAQMEVRFTLLGDANLDGTVDVGDLGALATSYGATGGVSWVNGDFNRDATVDVGDLGALATNYGTSLSTGAGSGLSAASPAAAAVSGSSSAVPEPASLGLLALGAMSMLGRHRRRRSL